MDQAFYTPDHNSDRWWPMSACTQLEPNLAEILAGGFVETYMDSNSPARAEAKARLHYLFEQAYGSGLTAGQKTMAQKLVHLIGDRTRVNAEELRKLASQL